MATINKQEILIAFTRLGELAAAKGQQIDLLLVGGGVMVILFETRQATHDLDVIILSPAEAFRVREFASTVALENNWPPDWLNDGAKGFLVGPADGPIIFQSNGISVRRPSIEQLVAMKLSAWRDEVDFADASRLLEELSGSRDDVWNRISPFLLRGRELKAKFAFGDLWEKRHDHD